MHTPIMTRLFKLFFILICYFPCVLASVPFRRVNKRCSLHKRHAGMLLHLPQWINNKNDDGDDDQPSSACLNFNSILSNNLNVKWMIPAAATVATTAAAATFFEKRHDKIEATRRAAYFWTHAGPMVVHYRFTQWWLKATDAPLEKRNVVYEKLHNRYCEPSLDIILNLKGERRT